MREIGRRIRSKIDDYKDKKEIESSLCVLCSNTIDTNG
jgi:hypothetical protein